MRAEDWERLASDNLSAARLLATPLPALAYYHAGYAVEFSLKFRIMRRERLRWWPSKAVRLGLHTHNSSFLRRLASIEADLRALGPNGQGLAQAWYDAQKWSPKVRYDPRAFPRRKIADMLDAVDKHGLMLWLLR